MGGSEEGAALEATGTVGDVVAEEGVAEVVQFEKAGERMRKIRIKRGGRVDGGYKREGSAAELSEAGFDPGS